VTHLAQLMDQSGNVSPWCFKRPRALRITSTSKVVNSAEGNWQAVTCKKCKTAFAAAHPDRVAKIESKIIHKFAREAGIDLTGAKRS
jgi:hypothetical protein